MPPSSLSYQTEGRVARLLSELPVYQQWRQRPLPRSLREQLAALDEQTLMSLAAQALLRLAQPPAEATTPDRSKQAGRVWRDD